jgi:hypothetical protein
LSQGFSNFEDDLHGFYYDLFAAGLAVGLLDVGLLGNFHFTQVS